MTKKIKIIIAIICASVVAIASTLAVLSVTKISFCMDINPPDRIVVYYKSEFDNMVFEQGEHEYDMIYSSIIGACKQRTITAIFSGDLSKDVKVCNNFQQTLKIDTFAVNFVYDTPQIVKYKKSAYLTHDGNYWYQSLIFNISSQNKFQYNLVAIIPPETSNQYVSNFSYNLHYNLYSNFGKTHSTLNKIYFKY